MACVGPLEARRTEKVGVSHRQEDLNYSTSCCCDHPHRMRSGLQALKTTDLFVSERSQELARFKAHEDLQVKPLVRRGLLCGFLNYLSTDLAYVPAKSRNFILLVTMGETCLARRFRRFQGNFPACSGSCSNRCPMSGEEAEGF